MTQIVKLQHFYNLKQLESIIFLNEGHTHLNFDFQSRSNYRVSVICPFVYLFCRFVTSYYIKLHVRLSEHTEHTEKIKHKLTQGKGYLMIKAILSAI